MNFLPSKVNNFHSLDPNQVTNEPVEENKKPLPVAPKNIPTSTTYQPIDNNPLIIDSSGFNNNFHNWGVSTYYGYTTNLNDYTAPNNPYGDPDLLLVQSVQKDEPQYFHPQQYYCFSQPNTQTHYPNYHTHASQTLSKNHSSVDTPNTDNGLEWKISCGISHQQNNNVRRSDSFKIEMNPAPVKLQPSNLEAHLEKPFEPPLKEVEQPKALNKKTSKEEVQGDTMNQIDTNFAYAQIGSTFMSQNLNNQADNQLASNLNHHKIKDISLTENGITKKSHSFPEISPLSLSHTEKNNIYKEPMKTIDGNMNEPSSEISTVCTETANEIYSGSISDDQQDESFSFDPNFSCQKNKYGFMIASYSLVHDKSNIKVYRRMASKTRNKVTQMTYAKYLIQISKLYDKSYVQNDTSDTSSKHQETPAQIRYRLLLEAGYWIKKLAKLGEPEALFIQGKWYLMGPESEDCVLYSKVHETKALNCFFQASRRGWTEAHYELANLWKKKGELKKALYYFEKGAAGNHTLSIYKLAKIFLRGQLKMKRDVTKGLDYLIRAADMNDINSAEPAFVLGCIYAEELEQTGIQSCVDMSKESIKSIIKSRCIANDATAFKYIYKSANQGYSNAIYLMGRVYETGMLGQKSDLWQAYQYYTKAAEKSHAGAMLDLSRIYSQGIPGLLKAQKEQAFKWCKRSADLGFDQAEYALGKCYEKGFGVTENISRALEYFGKAASKGYQPAAEKLNRPSTHLCPKGNKSVNKITVSFLMSNEKQKDNDTEQIFFLKFKIPKEKDVSRI